MYIHTYTNELSTVDKDCFRSTYQNATITVSKSFIFTSIDLPTLVIVDIYGTPISLFIFFVLIVLMNRCMLKADLFARNTLQNIMIYIVACSWVAFEGCIFLDFIL